MTKTTKTKQCTCLHDQRINKNIATKLVKKKRDSKSRQATTISQGQV